MADEPSAPRPKKATPAPVARTRPVSIISSAPPPASLETLRARTRTPVSTPAAPPPLPVEDSQVRLPSGERGWRLQTPPQAHSTVPTVNGQRDAIHTWNDSERRLWRIAGSLMVLAMVVVGVLGVLTFWPSLAQPSHAAAAAIEATPSIASAPSSAPAASAPVAKADAARAVAKPAAKIPAHRHLKIKHARRHR
ncbi:MAG TPA: hypothetical protein VFF06_03400 [Polyangia bacterium]|nr:hypothetical protein [Polyangia bacterium]